MNIGLSYRSRKNLYASVDLNYYNNMYLSMSPLYRTDAVLSRNMTEEDIRELRHQEKFDPACVLNASTVRTGTSTGSIHLDSALK